MIGFFQAKWHTRHTGTPAHRHTGTPPHHHTTTPPHHHTTTPAQHHTGTPPHRHTTTPAHHHTGVPAQCNANLFHRSVSIPSMAYVAFLEQRINDNMETRSEQIEKCMETRISYLAELLRDRSLSMFQSHD